ncbi:MAG: hypothetical protein PHS62_00990 [Patescibacteria group bacterium]|nr:hypothetical protein [Patescibacteria group bacterium]
MPKRVLIIIRIFLWLAAVMAAGWFMYMKIVPSGKISYTYNFDQPGYFIGKLTPADRVVAARGETQIKGDPAYFSLAVPRRFEKARVTVKFKNTTDFPVLELGILNDKVAWSYDLKPLQNKVVDQLALVWPVVNGADGSRLIQRDKKYDTIEKFLSNLPPYQEIGLYDYKLDHEFLLDKYAPTPEIKIYNCNFRGAYQFYTYIKNEDLNYSFDFNDLNLNADNDPVDIKVYSAAGLIYTRHVADDAAADSERQTSFKIPNLPEGVYRVSFVANDDIVSKTISSQQSQFSLINKVWLGEGGETARVLYSNSRLLSAQTINPASLGKIEVGQEIIDLKETYRQFSLKTASQPVAIKLAKPDIILSGDGVFAFSEQSLLDPRLKNIDGNLDINQEQINYILTAYQSPAVDGEWYEATADFDLTKAYQEKSKYQFLISLPGLKAEEANAGMLAIKEIKVDLSGTSLIKKLKKYFGR